MSNEVTRSYCQRKNWAEIMWIALATLTRSQGWKRLGGCAGES
jgi:hypothetical protein